jgi:hypothetical protein
MNEYTSNEQLIFAGANLTEAMDDLIIETLDFINHHGDDDDAREALQIAVLAATEPINQQAIRLCKAAGFQLYLEIRPSRIPSENPNDHIEVAEIRQFLNHPSLIDFFCVDALPINPNLLITNTSLPKQDLGRDHWQPLDARTIAVHYDYPASLLL